MVIVGVDEVGRGCWAGPIVAGAVVLSSPIKGLKDSKLLSKLQRQKLAAEIDVRALAVGLGWATPAEIDILGLTEVVRIAMNRAVDEIAVKYDKIIIDGNYNFLSDDPRAEAVVKADALIPAVSAASIIAKVSRDRFMTEQAISFPEYGFDKHVGYGTKLHMEMLKLHGVCDLHRKSYRPIAGIIGASA